MTKGNSILSLYTEKILTLTSLHNNVISELQRVNNTNKIGFEKKEQRYW